MKDLVNECNQTENQKKEMTMMKIDVFWIDFLIFVVYSEHFIYCSLQLSTVILSFKGMLNRTVYLIHGWVYFLFYLSYLVFFLSNLRTGNHQFFLILSLSIHSADIFQQYLAKMCFYSVSLLSHRKLIWKK